MLQTNPISLNERHRVFDNHEPQIQGFAFYGGDSVFLETWISEILHCITKRKGTLSVFSVGPPFKEHHRP